MDNFEFFTPTKIYFGSDVENEVGEIVKKRGYRRILLHYGGGSAKRSGLLDKIKHQLKEHGVEYRDLGGVEPNPKLELVREGIDLVQKEKLEFILAVGGGSVIDSSKAIATGAASDEDVWAIVLRAQPVQSALPVGCVLTLAAAGSEMSASAVITNGNLKRSLKGDRIRPQLAFMNPKLTFTVSKYQTGCGIVDIMMHTLERYFTEAKDCDLTDRLSEGLLLAVKKAGKTAIENPIDYEARATLMWASSLSHNNLMGCGKTFYFPAHKLEHDVSGVFDSVSHGAGLSVLFPAWAKYVYRHDVRKFAQFAVRVMNVEMDYAHPAKTALAGIEALQEYFRSLGMPATLRELGIMEKDYEKIVDLTTDGGKKSLVSYVPLDKAAILEIYHLAE